MAAGARSRGAVWLARAGKTQVEIGEIVGVSSMAVSNWLAGRKRPAPAKRALLLEAFGVPPAAWDEEPAVPDPPAVAAAPTRPAVAVAPSPPVVPASLHGKAHELGRWAHRMMATLETDPLATPLEKAKVAASIASTLRTIAALTGEDQPSARKVLRSAWWKAIEKAIERAGLAHPEAAGTYAAELRRAGVEHFGEGDGEA